jgi:ubiquinone/menaquinone biosynthesis C-methylase UbiE
MNWHARYVQQAKWTRDLRAYIFSKIKLTDASRALEVGCGTGAILSELPPHIPLTRTAPNAHRPDVFSGARRKCHGLDLDQAALAECRIRVPGVSLTQGNALSLPYPKESFEIVYCHFLLLWVRDPLQALLEMKRVAKPGGNIIAFAEPDYSHRIDKPDELVQLGRWQTESLIKQGADPGLGARLAELFFQAGIKINETGTIRGGENDASADEWEIEWAVIESDLAGSVSGADIQQMKTLDQQARANGARVLSVPTYFAWGSS